MDYLLHQFLKELNEKSSNRRTIIVMGGNASNLLGTFHKTKDIDICITSKDVDVIEFAREYSRRYNTRVDVFIDGWIQPMYFPDFFKRAMRIQSDFNNIELYIMDISDMILTKVDRWDGKDIDGIDELLQKITCSRNEIQKRYEFTLSHYNDPARIEKYKKNYQEFITIFGHLLK